jgi:hypothetical protein
MLGQTTGGYINPYKILEDVKHVLNSYLVHVRVPRIALYTETEIRELGIPVAYKDGEIIKSDINTYEEVMLPLSKLIEIADNGYTIRIKNRANIPAIVDTLQECLDGLNYAIEESELKEKIKDFMEKVLEINSEYVVQKKEETLDEALGISVFKEAGASTDITKPKIDISKLEV